MKFITDFIKKYGISAAIILGACIIGIGNFGLLGYFSTATLFVVIAVTFMLFHVPTLWNIIKWFINSLFSKRE